MIQRHLKIAAPSSVHGLRAATCLGLAILTSSALGHAQQFVRNTSNVPTTTGLTENVDFADVDQDGDWDAVFANGGDNAQQQETMWVNQGFLQGGTLGNFLDGTVAHFPAMLDQSRDIEFADFDGDSDVDIYISNTAQLINQGNRWWANMGNAQGGSAGFYADQTSTRWVNLGVAGQSSVPAGALIAGTFIDFSCDCDFADIDNDGDLDLFHSSYGSGLNGLVPSRIFLNDGSGHFAEYDPSGFQVPVRDIANGNPGIWCQGTQSHDTLNSTGVNCDIAASPLGIELGDIDGDLDIDMLMGSRNEVPRMFANRTMDNGGVFTQMRDVTGATYPPGYSTGQGHYEQEFGDFDNDGDLDIYGLNWLVGITSFNDATYRNNGAGVFASGVTMTGSGADDNESDFFDYNLDGNLDVLVANFSGQERVYTGNGAGTMTLASGVLPADSTQTLDADACDMDSDGDYDFVTANDVNQPEWYLQNTTANNDVTPAALYRLEQAVDRTPGPAPTVVRVQVYDNAPYYITWYNNVVLEVTVNGGPVTTYPMKSSMGQIFRGEIPGNLAGLISYRAVSKDQYLNTGVTPNKSYNSNAVAPGISFCAGDGLSSPPTTPCPCANTGAAGNGCASSFNSAGANITASGVVANDNIVLTGTGMQSSGICVFLQGDAIDPNGFQFGDGITCTGGNLVRLRGVALGVTVANGAEFPVAPETITLSARGGVTVGSGAIRSYTVFYRNAAAAFCPPFTFNASNSYQITW